MKPLGKKRCEVLKAIRKQIAKANGIQYEPAKCDHEGDCPGTCPQCDAEVKYIEQELCKKVGGMKKAAAVLVGSTITVGALSMGSCKFRDNVVGTVPCDAHDSIEAPLLDGMPLAPMEKVDTTTCDSASSTESNE